MDLITCVPLEELNQWSIALDSLNSWRGRLSTIIFIWACKFSWFKFDLSLVFINFVLEKLSQFAELKLRLNINSMTLSKYVGEAVSDTSK